MKKKLMQCMTVVLSVGLLAACSNNANDNTANVATHGSSPAGKQELKPISIEVDTRSATPVELPAPDKDVILKKVKEQFNTDLKYTVTIGNAADWRAKLGTRVAAGDLPDLIYFGDMNDYRNAVKQGYLQRMNDVYGMNNLPGNLKYITDEMLKGISDDKGDYYGIPVRPAVSLTGWFVRKDWLDTLKLEMPKTVEDFAKVTTAFANNDPDGNGKKDTYGYTAYGSVFGADYWGLMTSFLGFIYPEEYIKNGKLQGGFTAPAVRDYLTYMNQLMKNGGLDPDLAVNDATRKEQKIVQGQVGIFQYQNGYPTDIINKAKQLNPKAEFVYLPPVTGPAGKGFTSPKSGVTRIYGVTAKAGKDPEKLKRIVEITNWMNGGEGEQLALYGEEGVNHIKENGKVKSFTTPKAGQPNPNTYLDLYNLSGPFVTRLGDPQALTVRFPDPAENAVVQQMIANKGDVGSVYGLGLAKERSEMVTDLKRYREEMFSKFMYGAAALDDAGWNAYVKAHDEQYNGKAAKEAMLEDLKKAGVSFTQ
ncbi:extracellular solute-binding protein [Paenibacillus oryzisoli]|uniref:extracellular solute-binding protein n=1 Tax=Paenibacillus oryzisoli TaxID=1850517 RepID=UPI003D2A6330